MAGRTVKRLYDLEIDEISLVDRAANQHATVAIAKRAEDEDMPEGIFDASGTEVFEDELEHGDVVYDESGNEFVFVEDDADGDDFDDDTTAELQSGHYYEDEFADGELVGKRGPIRVAGRRAPKVQGPYEGPARQRKNPASDRMGRARSLGIQAGMRGRDAAAGVRGNFRSGALQAGDNARGVGRRAQLAGLRGDMQYRGALGAAPYRSGAVLLTAGGAAGGGATYAGTRRRRVEKSLGASVLEELSKSLSAGDRDQVIAKALDEVEVYKSQAEMALSEVEEMRYQQELLEYTEIAKGYGLPVNPVRLGTILKNAADTLPREDLLELDRLLTAQGELYDELGTSQGLATSEIHGQIEAMAYEAVGKADVSYEQAVVGVYEANPEAYDQYLAEQKG